MARVRIRVKNFLRNLEKAVSLPVKTIAKAAVVVKKVTEVTRNIDRATQTFRPIANFVAPVIAPLNRVLGIANSVLTPAAILADGESIEEAFTESDREQVLNNETINQPILDNYQGLEEINRKCTIKGLKEAEKYYAKGKAAFYDKNSTNAIEFFQRSKDNYKSALDVPEIDQKDEAKIQSRLAKLKNPDGKYSPMQLSK